MPGGAAGYPRVMIAFMLGLMAAVQPAPPARGLRVEELSNGQFRIIVANRGMSRPADMANAMIRAEAATRAEAARRCADRGGPVPVDRGSINVMANEIWETVQTFGCRMPAAPVPAPATPPAQG